MTPSDEEETGAAGEQLVRNNLIGWNGRGGKNAHCQIKSQLLQIQVSQVANLPILVHKS